MLGAVNTHEAPHPRSEGTLLSAADSITRRVTGPRQAPTSPQEAMWVLTPASSWRYRRRSEP